MLFLVFVIVLLVAMVSLGGFFSDEYGGVASFFLWLISSAIVAVALFGVWGGLGHLNAHELKNTHERRYELRALTSDSAIEGRSYFLGGGYINQERVLNYIVQNDDGSSVLGHTQASTSKIWEDEQDKPYAIQIRKEYGNWWFAFDTGYRSTYEYHYHIPAGSILESTTITNK